MGTEVIFIIPILIISVIVLIVSIKRRWTKTRLFSFLIILTVIGFFFYDWIHDVDRLTILAISKNDPAICNGAHYKNTVLLVVEQKVINIPVIIK